MDNEATAKIPAERRNKSVARIIAGFTRSNYVLALMGGFFIVIAMLITTYEVIARFGFNSPTKWSQEMSNYLLLLSIWFSTAYVMLLDGHIKVTIVVEKLPRKARAILTAVMYCLGLGYTVVLVWITWAQTYRAYAGHWVPEGAYKFALFPLYGAIFVGSVLLALAFVERIYDNVMLARKHDFSEKDRG